MSDGLSLLFPLYPENLTTWSLGLFGYNSYSIHGKKEEVENPGYSGSIEFQECGSDGSDPDKLFSLAKAPDGVGFQIRSIKHMEQVCS